MTREQLQKLIEYAAQRFSKTHDPGEKHEVARLTAKLAELDNWEILARAVARSRIEDPRAAEVLHALTFLESRAILKWPFAQFREGLYEVNDDARWQLLNSCLKRIKLALGMG